MHYVPRRAAQIILFYSGGSREVDCASPLKQRRPVVVTVAAAMVVAIIISCAGERPRRRARQAQTFLSDPPPRGASFWRLLLPCGYATAVHLHV